MALSFVANEVFNAWTETLVSVQELQAKEENLIQTILNINPIALSSLQAIDTGPVMSNTIIGGGASGFGFTVTIVDEDGNPVNVTPGTIGFDEEAATIAALTEAALENWGTFINGAPSAVLDVELTVASLEDGAVASAGPGGFFFTADGLDNFVDANNNGMLDDGETVIIESVSAAELQGRGDLNDDESDVNITVNSDLLADSDFHIDTVTFDPVTGESNVTLADDVPTGLIDLFSVLLHEIGHGLGFLGLRDTPTDSLFPFETPGGQDVFLGTLFDLFTDVSNPDRVVFDGPATVAAYGEAVALEIGTGDPGSDLGHFVGSESGFDTRLALLNPFVTPGDRVSIGALELAVLEDLGYNVNIPADLSLVNVLDSLTSAATPAAAIGDIQAASNGGFFIDLGLSQQAPFTAIASSFGVEFIGGGGSQSQRVLFNDNTSDIGFIGLTELLSAADLNVFTGTAQRAIDVRLFNPAQAVLANGTNNQTFNDVISFTLIGDTASGNSLNGTGANDVILGRDGNDSLAGNGGADILDGGNGNDIISDGAGDDSVSGGNGNDIFFAGTGANSFSGGSGADTLSYFNLATAVTINLATGATGGVEAGNDSFSSIENVVGSSANDLIIGNDGNNVLQGADGNDVFATGGGNDTLSGGNGEDQFIIDASQDNVSVTITDFDLALDEWIRIEGSELSSFTDLLAAATQDGSDALIDLGNGNSLRLSNVDIGNLDSDNFEFASTASSFISTGGVEIEFSAVGDEVFEFDAFEVEDFGRDTESFLEAEKRFDDVFNEAQKFDVQNATFFEFGVSTYEELTGLPEISLSMEDFFSV